MESLRQDIRFGVRTLAKNPGFTAIAVLALALGIGANTAIFSVVHAVLLRPLPYPQAERIVVPATVFERYNSDRGSVSFADYLDIKAQTDLFDAVAVFQEGSADLTGGDAPERLQIARVSSGFFEALGLASQIGRTFIASEHTNPASNVMLISHDLWMRRFGGDPKVLGARVEVSGAAWEVIGVMPKELRWPTRTEAWSPLSVSAVPPADLMRRDNHIFNAIARLREGVTIEYAQARLTSMAARIARESINRRGTSWKLHSLHSYLVGPPIRQALTILLGAVGFVLLIACVNVANLLLARGAAREREISIRTAIGAGRVRLVKQLLTESILLSLAGGAAGLLIAWWGITALIQLAPDGIPMLDQAGMNLTLLGFTLCASLVTAILFGLLPAVQTTASGTIRESGRSVAGGLRHNRIRKFLVVSEIALTIVLLVGAGLLIRSFLHLSRIDPGFSTDNIVTVQLAFPRSRYATGQNVSDAVERLAQTVRRIPGVISSSAISSLPLGGGGFYLGRVFLMEGQPQPPAGADTSASWVVSQPDYFQTMGIPLLQGRYFDTRDSSKSTAVIIVSQSMAKQMFPNESPLGKRIRSWRDENIYREIVGVVGDVRYSGLDDSSSNLAYIPHQQDSWSSMILLVRTQGDPLVLLPSLRKEIWSVDSKLAIAQTKTMRKVFEDELARPRFVMLLLAVFAGVALVLAAVGTYGVMSYLVMQRTREIGIRMALGARPEDVLGGVVRQGMTVAAMGLVLGSAGAFALSRVMIGMLSGIQPNDPATFVTVVLFLGLVVLAACYLPARRAAATEPMVALRHE